MINFNKIKLNRISIPFIIFLGISLQSFIVFSHTPAELGTIIPDDTYYYLKIAQNIADGNGSIFSLNKPTNGYHPLWMSVEVAVFSIFRFKNIDSYLYFIIGLSIFINFLSSFSLTAFLKKFKIGSNTRIIALVLFLFNPILIFLTCNGMETALLFLITINLMNVYYFFFCSDSTSTLKGYLIIGLLFGLMILVRTDSTLFVIILVLCELFKLRKRFCYKKWSCSILVALLVISPWLIWNLTTFGTIVQSSSYAVMFQNHLVYKIDYNTDSYFSPQLLLKILHNFFYSFKLFFRIISPNPKIINNYTILAFLIVFSFTLKLLHRKIIYKIFNHEKFNRIHSLLKPLIYFSLIIFLLFVVIRWYMQPWHFSLIILLLILFTSAYLNNIKIQINQKFTIIILSFIVIINALSIFWTIKNGFYWFGPEAIQSINQANINEVYKNKKIGIFDAGYIAFHSPNVEVVNLDGVVNNQALEYIKKGKLKEYIKKEKFYAVLSGSKYDKIFQLK